LTEKKVLAGTGALTILDDRGAVGDCGLMLSVKDKGWVEDLVAILREAGG